MDPHDKTGDQIKQNVPALFPAGGEPDRKDNAANPGGSIDQSQDDDQPNLPERAEWRQKESTGRRVHEGKLVPARVRIEFLASQNGLAGLEPNPVILRAVPAESMKHRYQRKNEQHRAEN